MSDAQPTRVLIVDDHDVVALGLQSLLEDVDDIDIVGRAGSVAAALEAFDHDQPDVVLADYRLPDGTGADVARLLRARSADVRVVMVTAAADRHVLAQALDSGCSGFVSKNADRDDLVAAVRAAADDDSYFSQDVLKHLVHLRRFEQIDGHELTDREVEVLQLTAEGLSADEIADRIHLSHHTVRNHLRHAMEKLDAHTKLDAVVKAVRGRVISIE